MAQHFTPQKPGPAFAHSSTAFLRKFSSKLSTISKDGQRASVETLRQHPHIKKVDDVQCYVKPSPCVSKSENPYEPLNEIHEIETLLRSAVSLFTEKNAPIQNRQELHSQPLLPPILGEKTGQSLNLPINEASELIHSPDSAPAVLVKDGLAPRMTSENGWDIVCLRSLRKTLNLNWRMKDTDFVELAVTKRKHFKAKRRQIIRKKNDIASLPDEPVVEGVGYSHVPPSPSIDHQRPNSNIHIDVTNASFDRRKLYENMAPQQSFNPDFQQLLQHRSLTQNTIFPYVTTRATHAINPSLPPINQPRSISELSPQGPSNNFVHQRPYSTRIVESRSSRTSSSSAFKTRTHTSLSETTSSYSNRYSHTKPPLMRHLGGLGPDYESEAYIEKLKRAVRQREYALKLREETLLRARLKEIESHKITNANQQHPRPFVTTSKQAVDIVKAQATEKRQKMISYAGSIPKKSLLPSIKVKSRPKTPPESIIDKLEEQRYKHSSAVAKIKKEILLDQ